MQNAIGQAALAALAGFCVGSAYLCDCQGRIIDSVLPPEASQAVPAPVIADCVTGAIAARQTISLTVAGGITLVTVILGETVLVLDNRKPCRLLHRWQAEPQCCLTGRVSGSGQFSRTAGKMPVRREFLRICRSGSCRSCGRVSVPPR